MPQYLALIYGPSDQQMNGLEDADPTEMAEYGEFGEAAGAAGILAGGNALQSTQTATTVSVLGGKGGEVITTDGPFAETKEVLGGYYLLDCKDLDEAIALGRPASPAPGGARSKSVPSWTSATRCEQLTKPQQAVRRRRPDRGWPRRRHPHPARRRPRPGRGRRAGGRGRGARAVAGRRRPRQPGGLAHHRGAHARRSTGCAAKASRGDKETRRHARCSTTRTPNRRRTRWCATTCCA